MTAKQQFTMAGMIDFTNDESTYGESTREESTREEFTSEEFTSTELDELKLRLCNCLEHDQFGCDAVNPGLHIDGLGIIGLPLSEGDAQRIQSNEPSFENGQVAT